MARLQQAQAQVIGVRREEALTVPSQNHFKQASLTTAVQREIHKGFRRIAGNIFICRATREFWGIKGGKLVRLLGSEVDNGETITAAPAENPGGFLREVLADLTF